jgi:pyruvate dehydrogenase E2 component (dihydrolipoamide acetyltransferase)
MPIDILLPQWGMGMNDGMVIKWLKKEGDRVNKGDALVEIESSKVNAAVESPAEGTLGRILVHEGVVVLVGARLGVLLSPGESPDVLPPPDPRSAPPSHVAAASPAPSIAVPAAGGTLPPAPSSGPRQVTPIARRVASELGVDLNSVVGTGPGGRVTEDDVRRAASQPVAESATVSSPPPSVIPVGEVIPVTGMRAAIARRMTASAQAPMVTLNTHADVTATTALIAKLVSDWRQHRLRPQYQDLVLAAVARALKDHPRANAHLLGNEIRVFSQINLGVAIAIQDGLIVPVIKDAGGKALLQVAQAVRDLAQRAKSNRLTVDDMTGSTFTVTNLGAYDVESFNPLLNPPEIGILGVGRVEERAAVADGQVSVRSIGHLSLTFDHRAWDGAPAGAFLKTIAGYLKDPSWMAA